ncbi:hypothetical protein ECH_0819 [Ehrlichia chaffeensis str. Arkansas]|uniref:Uncharacterized protein n=1 Tax=Ehrlichia chaffeensis (strain ATCC CRL-10679 / Arkansas) TaxID=205920 RepID=Q2GG18_EHRCR|nr:hypothetical protein ECH_0819 [Ehrlichia chaffeensis str. Arkansas]
MGIFYIDVNLLFLRWNYRFYKIVYNVKLIKIFDAYYVCFSSTKHAFLCS